MSAQLRELVAAYEAKPIYREYLDLDGELLSWRDLAPRSDGTTSLDAVLEDWRSAASPDAAAGPLFVLADFGSGKTTLLRRLQYAAATAYLDGKDRRVPLFVRSATSEAVRT